MSAILREPPKNKIFAALRQLWREQEKGRRYQDLASQLSDHLGIQVTPQKLSQWATGSDDRSPPWGAIYFLMDTTGYEVRLTTTGARLIPAVKKPEAEPAPPSEGVSPAP